MDTLNSSKRLLDIEVEDSDQKKRSKANPNLLRNLAYGLVGLVITCIIIGLSVALSLSLAEPPSHLATKSSVKNLSQQLTLIEKQLSENTLNAEQFQKDFDAIQVHLRHSSATALKNILIDQEQNIQQLLGIINASMRDLALDIPEEETWYKIYGAKLNQVQRLSIKREELLRLLQTGEVEVTKND